MSDIDYKKITFDGLWKNNPALVQVLGLCPLLAVSGSFVNALALGAATTGVLTLSNIAVSLIRNATTDAIRLPAFVMIIAAFTTCIEFLMNAFTHELYLILGIFIPLIVTNCIVLARVEAFANKNPPLQSLLDGVFMGVGLLWTLALLGGLRELIGAGTLFSGIDMVFPALQGLQLLPADYPGLLLAILPPGAFILLGCLIAWKNWVEARAAAHRPDPGAGQAAPVALADGA